MEITHTHLNMRALDDTALLPLAVRGDNRAFTVLYNRHRSSLFYYIYQRNPQRDLAEDLTMEVFGKAFAKIGSFVPNFTFKTWLYRIAGNHCIDYIRLQKQEKSHRADFNLQILSQIPDGQCNPEQAMIQEERIAMVVTLLQQLDPRYKRILELRYYEDLSYDEIALALEIPIGTVKAQLFRAKAMMRQKIPAHFNG